MTSKQSPVFVPELAPISTAGAWCIDLAESGIGIAAGGGKLH
jgi:hypothetical protein